MPLVFGGLTLSVLVAALEAYYEKDWPRHTFGFVALFVVIAAFYLFA